MSGSLRDLGQFPPLQGDLNMGFLLILTENHNHPTSHLLLMTQVGNPPQQSDSLLDQQDLWEGGEG